MIVPPDFYANCDKTYRHDLLDQLDKRIADIKELPGKEYSEEKALLMKGLIYKYARRYLIPKEFWRLCRTYLVNRGTTVWNMWNEDKARDHFFYEIEADAFFEKDDPDYYVMTASRYELYPNEPLLDFPHNAIVRTFCDFENNVMTRHPTKELLDKFDRMKKLYSQIKAAEKDTENWFNLLVSVKIDKFVRSNVEYRLGGNLFDKQLWKLYIGYLKSVDRKAMLVVYSKYVRFFMDDKEMLQEYKQQVKKHGSAHLSWRNLYEFEKQPQMLESDESGDEEMKTDVTVAETLFNPQICAAFFNNVNPQNDCSFHKPTISYILKNAPPSILQKLFKSGKYFFARKQTPICFRLQIHDGATVFNDECVTLNYSDKNLLNRIYLSTSLESELFLDEPVPETTKNFTSSLIPLLFQCDVKCIRLEYQKLTFKELKFLIGSKNCVELELQSWTCEVIDENGDHVDLENIMEFLPKIKKFELPTVKVNSNTAHALSALEFEGDITYIVIENIIGKPFDAEEFKNFIVAKRAYDVNYNIFFNEGFNAGFVATLKQILGEYGNTCAKETTYFNIRI